MKKTIALCALAITAVAGSATAGIQIDSFSFGPQDVPFAGMGSLDKFDNNGGLHVLTGIKITFEGELSATVSATALSGPQTVAVGVIGNSNATDGLFNLGLAFNDNWVSPVLNSGDTHNYGTLSVSDVSVFNVPMALWALYTAPGPDFTVNYSGNGLFGIQGGGNATIDVTDFAGSGTVTVEYHFDVVPAPGAAAVLGLGGLMAARRRR
jgi:hypothetical protein